MPDYNIGDLDIKDVSSELNVVWIFSNGWASESNGAAIQCQIHCTHSSKQHPLVWGKQSQLTKNDGVKHCI